MIWGQEPFDLPGRQRAFEEGLAQVDKAIARATKILKKETRKEFMRRNLGVLFPSDETIWDESLIEDKEIDV